MSTVFRRRWLTLLSGLAASIALASSGCVLDQNGGGADARGDAVAGADVGTDAGAGSDADAGWEQRPVTEQGPFEPGYREMTVTYQAVSDNTLEQRELNLSVWYPTTQEDGLYPRYFDLLDREEVIMEATVAPLDSMPLLVFSHGNGGIAEQNWFMTEYWAAHGWVVASPDHTGNTLKQGGDINIEAAVYRPQDIRAVIDHMTTLDPDHPLAGKLSGEIAMSGHSFGGYTTLANAGAEFAVEELNKKCENGNASRDYCDTFDTKQRRELFRKGFFDGRIDVAIPQAPAGAIIFEEGLEELKVPTLLMTGGRDQTLPNNEEGDPIWSMMKGDEHRRLNFPDAGHFTFSNMCEFFNKPPDRIKKDGCGAENIDPPKAHETINVYALAFARYHLWGDEEAREIIDDEHRPVGRDHFQYWIGTD